MQQDILPIIKKVTGHARTVALNQEAVIKFCAGFSLDTLALHDSADLAGGIQLDLPQAVSLCCVFNTVNFCFWSGKGQKKWATNINGKMVDGATGLFRAFAEAYKNNVPLLNARFLSQLKPAELHLLLNGNLEIPLLSERTKCLNQAGEVLLKIFGGDFMNVFKHAGGDAITLTDIFIKFFSFFNDYAILDGVKIEFHKRAQFNAALINYQLIKHGKKELTNLNQLTAFADYKVPQVLRGLGILTYTTGLAAKVDSYEELKAGSREEIEIRAATIWAVEQMKELLRPRFPALTAHRLDAYLWTLGQTKSPEDRPYHRTKTIFY